MSQPSLQAVATGLDHALEQGEEVSVSSRLRSFFQLTKPRLNFMVLITTFVGFFLGTVGDMRPIALFHAVFGTALIAGGASTLNMWLEKDRDARMARTAARPIPSGRVSLNEALVFGVSLGLLGTFYLFALVNPLTSALGLLSFITYVFIYTPMKARSTFNTAVGAISGALPPMMGWTAARGTLDIEAVVLFAVLFLWQHPHFFALAWMYKKDYAEGGFQMLPEIDNSGSLTARLMILFSLALVPVSLILTLEGLTGAIYAGGAIILGLLYTWPSLGFLKDPTIPKARKVFKASLIYLPALLALMMIDKQIF